jgi:cbb3-type cytochrome oxidase subunit 1
MFWIFYIIGGVIGVLIHLRFALPVAYYDLKDAWGFFGGIKTIVYHLVRIFLLGCVVFFASWVSVGVLILYYDYLRSELERTRL